MRLPQVKSVDSFTFCRQKKQLPVKRYRDRNLQKKCRLKVQNIMKQCKEMREDHLRIKRILNDTEEICKNSNGFLRRLEEQAKYKEEHTPRTVPLFYKNFREKPLSLSQEKLKSRGKEILLKYGCFEDTDPHASIFDTLELEKEDQSDSFQEQQMLRKEVEDVVKEYKQEKYTFVYGNKGQGRFLSEQGFDMIGKCDQVLNLNPQYVFLAERLSKLIRKL